jgi:hypothetical protein
MKIGPRIVLLRASETETVEVELTIVDNCKRFVGKE